MIVGRQAPHVARFEQGACWMTIGTACGGTPSREPGRELGLGEHALVDFHGETRSFRRENAEDVWAREPSAQYIDKRAA
jgi:hypothetical protein